MQAPVLARGFLRTFAIAVAVCSSLVAVPLVVSGFDPGVEFYSCVNRHGTLTGPISTSPVACQGNNTPVHWNSTGPAGAPGEKGDQGDPGADGKDGEDGADGADGAPAPIDHLEAALDTLETRLDQLMDDVGALEAELDQLTLDGGPALASLDDLQGIACTSPQGAGTVNVSVDAAGLVLINCTPTGGGGDEDDEPPIICDDAVPLNGTNNANYACSSGQIVITSCQTGWANGDGVVTNGCEVNVSTSAAHCGAIGNAVPLDGTNHANYACSSGQIVITSCQAGWTNVDGIVSNGCELFVT